MRGRGWLKPLHLEMLVKAATMILDSCIQNNLGCRDPPLASTRLLYSMGYTQYQVRSLWGSLSEPLEEPVIYKYHRAIFRLSLQAELRGVCSIEYNGLYIPLDDLDASMIKRRSRRYSCTPRTHTVKAYVWGTLLDHAEIKINIVRLLSLLARDLGLSEVRGLMEGLNKLVWERDPGVIEGRLAYYLNHEGYRRILLVILPYVPKGVDELVKVSPFIRRLHH